MRMYMRCCKNMIPFQQPLIAPPYGLTRCPTVVCGSYCGKHAGCGKRKEFKFTHKLLSLNSDINLLIL